MSFVRAQLSLESKLATRQAHIVTLILGGRVQSADRQSQETVSFGNTRWSKWMRSRMRESLVVMIGSL